MFTSIISRLIDEKREGTYWDFKREHHHNKAKLLHDIICLANNIDNRDAFLIFGVTDDGDIVGVEKDENRRNQEHLTSFLRGKKFAGSIAPYVILRTINFRKHEVDLLVIKKSDKVPFYLEQPFKDSKTIVHAGSIYSRIEDRNTPLNSTADPYHTELLWKIRFGLVPKPIDRLKSLLLQKTSWKINQLGYYFEESPEFTVVENEMQLERFGRLSSAFYAHNQMNARMSYSYYECRYHNTILFESQTAILDSGRYHTPIPEFSSINIDRYSQNNLGYRYFIQGSLLHNLHLFMYEDISDEARYARQRFLEIIPIFKSEFEKSLFENFIKTNLTEILSELEDQLRKNCVDELDSENEREKAIFHQQLQTGRLLVRKLGEYRSNEEDLL